MALLKKLRNSTEFCSDECRQKYEDESNRLAVSRLMQQRKPKPARAPLPSSRAAAAVAERPVAAAVAVAAVAEPPIAEFIPQTAIAELQIHPIAAKVDWQARQCQQVLPTLSDEVLGSLVALCLTQLEEQYGAPRGPRPLLIDELVSLSAPVLWTQPVERQALPLTAPNLTQSWTAVWPAEWRELIAIVREESGTPDAAVATETVAVSPVVESPAVSQPVPPAYPPVKMERPLVVPAETLAPNPVSETVAMPQPALQRPEVVMLPLRPRIAIAPKPAEPVAKESDKTLAVKPILVPKNAADKPKAAPAKIPDVRLETRKAEAPPAEEVKPSPAPKAAEPKRVQPKAEEEKAAEPVAAPALNAPTFGAPSKSSAATGLWHRMPWWERCAAVAVFLLSIGGWLINGRPAEDKRATRSVSLPSPAAPAPGMGADSWTSERATDLAGAALNRQLSVYRPSKTMKDYVVEFQGTIQERALGWIVRAKDASNYYCLKLEVDKTGMAKLIRFGVVDGKEDTHTQMPLSLLPKPENGVYKVRVEAKGPKISTYINGQAVDVWVDERLQQGAAGFTNERGERAVVKSVQVSF